MSTINSASTQSNVNSNSIFSAPARPNRAARSALFAIVTAAVLAQSMSAYAYDRRVKIHNRTSHQLLQFFASNVSEGIWQEDMLGMDVINPWTSVIANIDDGSGYCRYDLKAVFDDGSEVKKFAVNVCEVEAWTISE